MNISRQIYSFIQIFARLWGHKYISILICPKKRHLSRTVFLSVLCILDLPFSYISAIILGRECPGLLKWFAVFSSLFVLMSLFYKFGFVSPIYPIMQLRILIVNYVPLFLTAHTIVNVPLQIISVQQNVFLHVWTNETKNFTQKIPSTRKEYKGVNFVFTSLFLERSPSPRCGHDCLSVVILVVAQPWHTWHYAYTFSFDSKRH